MVHNSLLDVNGNMNVIAVLSHPSDALLLINPW